MTEDTKRPMTAVERIERDLKRLWAAMIVTVALILVSLSLNAVRTVKVDRGINRLQAENTRLLRERADLLVKAKRP